LSDVVKFHTNNMQSDGINNLKRIEFGFMGKFYKFALNPEEYVQVESARVTVTQTKGGAWVDDFGSGLPSITMKGTTGWKGANKDSTVQSGFAKFKQLRDLLREYYDKLPPGSEVTPDKELIFQNYTDGEHWIVIPQVFQLLRSASRPLIYQYNIQLICVRPAFIPSDQSVSNWEFIDTLEYVQYD